MKIQDLEALTRSAYENETEELKEYELLLQDLGRMADEGESDIHQRFKLELETHMKLFNNLAQRFGKKADKIRQELGLKPPAPTSPSHELGGNTERNPSNV